MRFVVMPTTLRDADSLNINQLTFEVESVFLVFIRVTKTTSWKMNESTKEIKFHFVEIKAEQFSDNDDECEHAVDPLSTDSIVQEEKEEVVFKEEPKEVDDEEGESGDDNSPIKKEECGKSDRLEEENEQIVIHSDTEILVSSTGGLKVILFSSDSYYRVRKGGHTCIICSKIFLKKTELNRHMDRHKGIMYSCGLCKTSFRKKFDVNKHVASKHEKDKHHACELCNKSFMLKSVLSTHVANIHSAGVPHKCTICQKVFNYKGNLSRHMESIHGSVKHSCKFCDKTFSQKSHLQGHMASVHDRIKFPCHLCNRKFSDKQYLENHRQTIHGATTFMCTICDRTFCSKSSLIRHMIIHNKNTHNDQTCTEKDQKSC